MIDRQKDGWMDRQMNKWTEADNEMMDRRRTDR